MQNVIVMYTWWPCTLVSYNNKAMYLHSQGGLKGRNDTQGEGWGEKDWRLQTERGRKEYQRGSGTLASLSALPLSDPLPHNSISSRSKSFWSILYKSWCLYLRELLRVVTVLEVSSASSSSFVSRLLLKNLKMESKLIQEVSSCRSVPAETLGQSRSMGSSRVSTGSGLDTQLQQCCCIQSCVPLLVSCSQILWAESLRATAHTFSFTSVSLWFISSTKDSPP